MCGKGYGSGTELTLGAAEGLVGDWAQEACLVLERDAGSCVVGTGVVRHRIWKVNSTLPQCAGHGAEETLSRAVFR